MIRTEHLQKSFGQQNGQDLHALRDVSLRVGKGQIFGVLGESGAGKSTLIRCINLLERPDSGEVWVDGQELTGLPEAELRQARRQMGMIIQHFNLLNSRNVSENIAFGLELAGVAPDARRKRVEELLDLVHLSDKAKAYPRQLSGGQKQRVGIARALATHPKLLLSDEATSALDPQTTLGVLDLLKDLNHQLGLTILLITHQMDVVRRICDHAAVMREGRVVEQGPINELILNPDGVLAQAIFPPSEPIPAEAGWHSATLTFLGDSAREPLLAELVRSFALDVNILGGSIQPVAGNRVGRLQVQMKGPRLTEALQWMRERGIQVELH